MWRAGRVQRKISARWNWACISVGSCVRKTSRVFLFETTTLSVTYDTLRLQANHASQCRQTSPCLQTGWQCIFYFLCSHFLAQQKPLQPLSYVNTSRAHISALQSSSAFTCLLGFFFFIYWFCNISQHYLQKQVVEFCLAQHKYYPCPAQRTCNTTRSQVWDLQYPSQDVCADHLKFHLLPSMFSFWN